MAAWGVEAPRAVLVRLGCRPCGSFGLVRAPSAATIRRVVAGLRPGQLEALLRTGPGETVGQVAVDGKALRGSRPNSTGVPVMVLGAMNCADGRLLACQKVDGKHNEITGFAPLLAVLDLRGVIVTADAMHTQRDHARVLVEDFGAHDALTIKRNQPGLWRACRDLPWPAARVGHRGSEVGHGRLDTRVTQVVTYPDLDFPYAAQIVRITRYRTSTATGRRSRETVYVVTDLSAAEADPARITEAIRAHWGIENKIHYVRDVTMNEDASRIRTGYGPQNTAVLRSVALNYLRRLGKPIADAIRALVLHAYTAPLDLYDIPADLRVPS